MTTKQKDITRKAFENAMARLGWTKPEVSFLGYWQRNGLHVSELNYRTRREALLAFSAAADKHDREAVEREARRASGGAS